LRNILLFFISVFVFINSTSVFSQLQGQPRTDSLLKVLSTARHDTTKVLIMLELSVSYLDTQKSLSLDYANEGLKLASSIGWKNGIGKSYAIKSLYYEETGKFDTAVIELQKALKIFEKSDNLEYLARINNNLANLYETLDNYPLSLEHHFKSLSINTKIGRQAGIAINYSNIGLVYWALQNDSLAFIYFQKALKIDKQLNRKTGLPAIYTNLGMYYQKKENDSLALEHYFKSLELNTEINDKYGQSINHRNIGLILTNKGMFDSAYYHLYTSLKIETELDNKLGFAEIYSCLGFLHYTMTIDSLRLLNKNNIILKDKIYHYNQSQEYINKSINLFRLLNSVSSTIELYKLLSQIKSELKDYKSALENYILYETLKDSIFSVSNNIKISNLEMRRENELKDKEIVILQTEKKAQQLQSYLLGSGVIVLLGAFGIAYLRFREKKKLSDKLAIQNAEIETQKSIVDEKNEQIYDSIRYASTIQHAILPWDSTLQKAFRDIFIFYKPKDIVSGDSYWFQEVGGIKFLAVIDCTGHGIPGSMLTVIASSVLDDAVLSKRLTDTGEILTYMNNKVTEVLNQRLKENETRDGMEIALIAVKDNKIQFSGAGRPLYLKNDTYEIIKTDKRGIAGQTENDDYQFSSVEIEKSENLFLYLTTDGFADQMNEESRKYSTKRFLQLLESISVKELLEQKLILENEFSDHKGDRNQIDDITILGVKI